MPFVTEYASTEPSRPEIDRIAGATVLEFGNSWCGHCRRATPLIAQAFADHEAVRHIKIADASGRRLGRSFGVKLWPTLIFLRNGREVSRLIRPREQAAVDNAFAAIDPA